MHITPPPFRALRERVRQGILPLLAVALSFSTPVFASAQDIFTVDAAPKTSLRSRDPALRDFHALPDGKIIALGSFKFIDGTTVDGMARLNVDGSFDPTFVAPYPGARISRCGVIDDGRIIILATLTNAPTVQRVLQRLLPDGSIDPTFAPLDMLPYQPQGIYGLPDGGAYFIHQQGTNTMRVLRVLPNGQLDPAFNSAPLSGSFINAAAVGPANQVALFRNSGIGATSVVLLSSTGAVQPAFTGIQVNFRVSSAAFEPSGALVLAGASVNPAPTVGLMRVLPSGARDTTFSGVVPFANGLGSSVVRLTDGTFMATTGSPTPPAVVHFSATGVYLGGINGTTLVANSVSVGQLRSSPVAGAYAFGTMVALGGVPVGPVARVNADRSIDESFLWDVLAPGRVAGLAPYAGGHLLAGSFSEIGNQDIFNLARLGSDDAFNSLVGYFPPGAARAFGLADGGALLTGSFGAPFSPIPGAVGVLKIEADGTPNGSFQPAIPQGTIEEVVQQPDGRLVFAGRASATIAGTPVLNLFRTNANGTIDTTFNNVSALAGGTGQGITSVAVDSQGRIVVAGSFTTFQGAPRAGLARVLPNGILDPAFVPAIGLTGAPRNIVFLPDGSFYVAGVRADQLGSPASLHRFNADGSLHAQQLTLPGIIVGSFVLHPDGSIFIAGSSSAGAGVFRMLSSGELDPLFECIFDAGTTSPIVVDGSGRVLVGGVFSTVNGQPHEGLVRLAPVPRAVLITGPDSYTLNAHDTLTLTASTSGFRTPPPLQWFFGGSPIPGATSSTLTLTDVQPADAGLYDVRAVLGPPHASVVSNEVSLTVIPEPFAVSIGGPASYTLRLHDTLTLTAHVVSGGPSPTYQWFLDGQPIAGATGPVLTVTHLVPKNEGVYSVRVTGEAGTLTSAGVSLTLVRGTPVK